MAKNAKSSVSITWISAVVVAFVWLVNTSSPAECTAADNVTIDIHDFSSGIGIGIGIGTGIVAHVFLGSKQVVLDLL